MMNTAYVGRITFPILTDDANCSHIGIANSLPTTAYVKMIDVFMLYEMTFWETWERTLH